MVYAAPIRTAEAKKVEAPAGVRARPAAPLGGRLQAKFALAPRSDAYEREADSAAAHVVSGRAGLPCLSPLPAGGGFGGGPGAATALAQRACAACKRADEEARAAIQRKCACGAAPGEPCCCRHDNKKEEDEHPELRIDRAAKRGETDGETAIQAVEDVVSSPGRPLAGALRHDMEQGFGRDFGQVRIHDSPRAAASAEGIGAHAYTVGNHIAFNRGQYRPDTESGRLLLAHELAHTVQQAGASPAGAHRVSRPADRHEAEAHRAARAAVTGAPVPVLSPGAAPISRYSLREFGEDVVDFGEAAAEGAVDLAGDVADAAGAMWDTAVAIAGAIGGAVSLDGTTIVIDVPQFDPCPEIEFAFTLSDIGLDPTLYFPIAAGGFTVGVLDVIGALGIEVNLDPGIGFRLEGCTFGPAQIRIDPVSARATVAGAVSIATASMVSLGADLALRADVTGIMTIPFDPPIILIAPVVGVEAGGTMALMLQNRGTVDDYFRVSMGIGGLSAATHTDAEIGYALDFAYGLFGAVDIMGFQLCRVGWPLDSIHRQIAARLTLSTALSLNTSGLSFSFLATARPLATNPLDDLSFAFDQSRLEDDCWLCEFFTDNGLMPGQNGYDWAHREPSLPRLAGPLRDVYARDPGMASGALCRGTCGVDCPGKLTCDVPYDRIICENVGDHHVWHTYVNYATCGTHQGCRDHDACYDYASMMPVWGFGGVLVGPMYRACDLEAMCGYSFKQGVTWALGGGPYDGRLAYADYAYSTPGCLGPCPENVAPEGEAEIMLTCLEDRELWPGLELEDNWMVDFGNARLFQGFVEVPYIVGVHYGVDAHAHADADAFASFGPINLENACLMYDPATMTYSGSADLVAYLNGGASASITATLEGWLSDFLCLVKAVTIRGTLNAGVIAQLPSEVRASVLLYCANGDLEVIPSLSLETCPQISGEVNAGLDVFLFSLKVWGQEWPLLKKSIQRCWDIGFEFDPFVVGTVPDFRLVSTALDVADVVLDLFEPARVVDIDRRPARSPVANPRLLFPCIADGGDDNGGGDNADCPRKATGADGDRLYTPGARAPRYGPTTNLTITSGASAGVGSWMEAPFLTSSHPPGQETRDAVQRNIYRQPGLPTRGCVGSGYKQSQVYVKGHLLNAGLGGPAEERNLFPITGQANSLHKTQVEQGGLRVVPRVNSGNELMYYKVTVQNISAAREIRTSAGNPTGLFEISATFHCEVADYQYCDNDTLSRNPMRTVDVPSEFVFHPSGGRAFDTIMRPCPR